MDSFATIFVWISVILAIAALAGMIINPEKFTEDMDAFVHTVHRAWVKLERIWEKYILRRKPPVKWAGKKIGEVESYNFEDGGLVATMRIDDEEVREKLRDKGGAFSIGASSPALLDDFFEGGRKPDAFIEKTDGTRLALDVQMVRDKLKDGEITPNQARKAMGIQPIKMPGLSSAAFEARMREASRSLNGAAESLKRVSERQKEFRQTRYNNCPKHRFKLVEKRPLFIGDVTVTEFHELVYSCRRCGMGWEIRSYLFWPEHLKNQDMGHEPMGSVDYPVAITEWGTICPVHNRNHGNWICIRKE